MKNAAQPPVHGVPLGTIYGSEKNLCCPVCGFDYSHIREVYTEMGSDPYEAGVYEGTVVKDRTGSRRSALAIVIDGECQHSWILRIQQHKGVNIVESVPIGDFDAQGNEIRYCVGCEDDNFVN